MVEMSLLTDFLEQRKIDCDRMKGESHLKDFFNREYWEGRVQVNFKLNLIALERSLKPWQFQDQFLSKIRSLFGLESLVVSDKAII